MAPEPPGGMTSWAPLQPLDACCKNQACVLWALCDLQNGVSRGLWLELSTSPPSSVPPPSSCPLHRGDAVSPHGTPYVGHSHPKEGPARLDCA